MTAEQLGNLLAPVNATFNLASTALLVAGFVFIRRRDIRRHRNAMVGAFSASARGSTGSGSDSSGAVATA